MTDVIIKTEGLKKNFGKLEVLKGIDFSLEKGEVLVIIGFNLVYGFMGSGIDNFGHLGGLLGGFAVGCGLGGYKEKFGGRNALYLAAALLLAAVCL